MTKKQPLPGVAVACVASVLLPESGSVRPLPCQSTSFGTVSLTIPLERKQDSVTIRNCSSLNHILGTVASTRQLLLAEYQSFHGTAWPSYGSAGLAAAPGTRRDPQAAAEALGLL